MDSRSNLEILLGMGPLYEYPEWDLLIELDRRERRRNNPARKAANRRAHKYSPTHKALCQKYHREVISPRRKATRLWMKEHPREVQRIRRKL